MYRFTRTAQLKQLAMLPRVIGAQKELVDYINGKYDDVNCEFGVETLGQSRMFWMWQSESLAKYEQVMGELMQDEKYMGFIESQKEFWLEGSLNDSAMMVVHGK